MVENAIAPSNLTEPNLTPELGYQRDWVWRGWRLRYTFLRSRAAAPNCTYPILMLHGFGSSLRQWRANLTELSQHHTVYGVDFLGFGASEKAPTRYRVDLWAEQVIQFWRTFIGQPVILVGHSLGAVVALTAAVRCPEMLHGLGLLTLPPSRPEVVPEGLQKLTFAIERLFANPLILRPVFQIFRQPRTLRAALKLAYANPDYVTDQVVNDFVEPTSDRGAAGVFCRLAKARTDPNYTPDIHELLPQVTCPILLLWGKQDRVVPLSQGRSFPDLNPRLKLLEIPEAGHCLYDECRDRVNRELLQWIDQDICQPSPS
jgi:pimeloyl-ACP methyl ester carboxylesterase